MSTQGSKFPSTPSPQFQSQISALHGESAARSTTGDHLFKARSGFAQVKPEAEEKYGSFATQIIIFVYLCPKFGLTLDVLVNVVMQLCSHTSVAVEQPANPLPRAQFFLQASSNVVTGVPVAPPAAEVPPVEIAPPVVAEPPAAGAPPVALVPPVAKVPPAVALVPPVAVALVPPVAVALVPPVAAAPPGGDPVPLLLLPQDQT
jgi:hypothetical protein